MSPSIGWFLKLPKKSQYLGYSDPKGILYFLDGQLVSPIVRYHEAINEQGHDTISMELDSDHKYSIQNDAQKIFRCSAEVGDKFWLLGSSPFSSLDLHASGMLANTAVWYKKKQKVRFGPNLPSLLGAHEIGEFNHFCTLGINSTHLMIFGITKITDEHDFNKVALIDFIKQKWTFWTPIPLDEYEGITNCHASLEIDKSGSLKIWLMAEKYSEIIDQIPNSYLEVLTHNFGFGNGWEFVSTYDTGGNILSKTLSY